MQTTTATIPSNVKELTYTELLRAEFAFSQPFQLTLTNGDIFISDKIIRLVPHRRIIVTGRWQNKSVIAKIFFHPKHQKRHVKKELAGVSALTKNKIPTPPLYHHCAGYDPRIYILIFEYLDEAVTPDELWHNRKNIEDVYPLLQKIILELATQHVFGVLQHDLHLKNFLLHHETLYTLDPAEITVYPPLLSKSLSMQNLAIFFSQLGVGAEPYYKPLFKYYAKARGWIFKESDYVELALLIKRHNEKRWQRYRTKIIRECSTYVCLREWGSFGMLNRNNASPEMLNFFRNPDAIFSHPNAELIKNGRSATVIKITLGDQTYVIKRYNMKGFWHWLRRCLRPTRAATCWRLAQKMDLFGISTAKPIAFIEKKFLSLRGKSYYVTEYVSGAHAADFFDAQQEDDKTQLMINEISELIKNILKIEITHGDLKITNILVNEQEKPVLIDLDGAAEHVSLSSLRGAWRREVRRFLRNFSHQPALRQSFEKALQK